ncbi:MAG: glycosyltransferase, partial [Elusimicrobia bacterium]|nr:glycosyltransferase [Elusimicrobiota bacterium]
MKVALIHDWLTGMRGGEKVLEVLCRVFPEADVYTLVHVPGSVSKTIESHRIVPSVLQKFPGIEKRYRHALPLMPWAVRRFDLSGHDLIISSSHCVAKGVRRPPNALHICYCHSPMRYIWDQFDDYFGPGRASGPVRAAMSLLRRPLQRWDIASNSGVDAFIANSHNVASRIKRFYNREADVIHPPVDLSRFP